MATVLKETDTQTQKHTQTHAQTHTQTHTQTHMHHHNASRYYMETKNPTQEKRLRGSQNDDNKAAKERKEIEGWGNLNLPAGKSRRERRVGIHVELTALSNGIKLQQSGSHEANPIYNNQQVHGPNMGQKTGC